MDWDTRLSQTTPCPNRRTPSPLTEVGWGVPSEVVQPQSQRRAWDTSVSTPCLRCGGGARPTRCRVVPSQGRRARPTHFGDPVRARSCPGCREHHRLGTALLPSALTPPQHFRRREGARAESTAAARPVARACRASDARGTRRTRGSAAAQRGRRRAGPAGSTSHALQQRHFQRDKARIPCGIRAEATSCPIRRALPPCLHP